MKSIKITFLLFVFSSFTFVSFAFAQNNSKDKPIGVKTVCLKTEKFYPPSCPFPEGSPDRVKCVQELPEAGYPDPQKPDHTALIAGEGFKKGDEVILIGCISLGGGFKCSSGQEDLDKRLESWGFDIDPEIASSGEYEFKAPQNPIVAEGSKLQVVVRSASAVSNLHAFYGVLPVWQEPIDGEETSIQLATFQFSQPPEDCVSVRWDPEGYVFDASTLEPIEGVKVTIADENRVPLKASPGFNPTVKTRIDGSFFFYVPAGFYTLLPEHPGYRFPVALSEVNKNYSKQYRCDQEGLELYNDYHILEEKPGKVLRCDIPMKKKGEEVEESAEELKSISPTLQAKPTEMAQQPTPAPKPVEPKIIKENEFYSGNFSVYTFRLNRSDCRPNVYYLDSSGNKITVGRSKRLSDSSTVWTVTVSQSELYRAAQNLSYLSYEAVCPDSNQTSRSPVVNNLFVKILKLIFPFSTVSAQAEENKLAIPLRYIEGYAYDSLGNVVPNATVEVISLSNNKVLFSVKADANGYFKIPSGALPPFGYKLRVNAPAGKSYELDTVEFLKKNKKYLDDNKIDLVRGSKAGKPVVFSKEDLARITVQNKPLVVSPTRGQDQPPLVDESHRTEESEFAVEKNPTTVLFWSFLILTLILAALIVLLVAYKKIHKK